MSPVKVCFRIFGLFFPSQTNITFHSFEIQSNFVSNMMSNNFIKLFLRKFTKVFMKKRKKKDADSVDFNSSRKDGYSSSASSYNSDFEEELKQFEAYEQNNQILSKKLKRQGIVIDGSLMFIKAPSSITAAYHFKQMLLLGCQDSDVVSEAFIVAPVS
ncbi:hypothetical protein BDF20DRAFT_986520 [Mycotypha africana]|uniref:uncharacterized protein n=1 Tax=Mycotypha africana TaxID=64632 RepID=UPI002301B11C|nr:uncharacterized protein BDF20DRAFT_986520 [Mycotypha africana]KAI8984669.1 hypothetical protein BDF20DRAFT_986520 [Mycotypha africana]